MTERQVRIAQSALGRAQDESRASNQVMDYPESLFDAASPRRPGGKPVEAKAMLLNRQRRFAEAVPLLRLAIAGYSSTQYAHDSPAIAAANVELAASLIELGQAGEAQSLLDDAGPIVDRELSPTHRARVLLRRLRARART